MKKKQKHNFYKIFFYLILFFKFPLLKGEENFLDSKNLLRSHLFEDDILFLTKEKAKPLETIILEFDSKIQIKKFDEEGREISRKLYELVDDEEKLRESFVYYYKEKSSSFYKQVFIQHIDSFSITSFFDEKGKISRLKKRVYDKNKEVEKGSLLLTENYSWDEKKRLVYKEEIFEKTFVVYENSYEKPFANEFVYDQKKYLNTVLIEETFYLNENEYLKTSYFPNAQKIISLFKDGLKIKEEFYAQDRLIRSIFYD